MDPLFNPHEIVAVGLKFGTGDGSDFESSGHFGMDNFTWPNGIEPKYGFENIDNSIQMIANIDANHVAVLVTWYMDDLTSVEIHPDSLKTHSDEELVALVDSLHSLGINVMLKPHVDVEDDTWRGHIQPSNLEQWFSSYETFITHYADLAERLNVNLFCVGTEFESLSGAAFKPYWENIIKNVKTIYHGPITYAANWDGFRQLSFWALAKRTPFRFPINDGFQKVSFWNEIDLVGINAYFPLSCEPDPSLESLIDGWTNYSDSLASHNWVEEIQAFQDTINKPIIFTEIGYGSRDFAACEPWLVVEPSSGNMVTPNATLQARCYEAAFRVFQDKEWFHGFFWWNWLPWSDAGGLCDFGFTPQNKPAQDTLKKWHETRLVLNPPTNLLISESTNTTVTLKWGSPVTGETSNPSKLQSFKIYRSTGSPVQVEEQNKIEEIGADTTTFTDSTVVIGTKYYYVVTAEYDKGESSPSNEAGIVLAVQELTNTMPETFDLLQNYPNPFNPETTIQYQLPKTARVKLVIYDLLGRLVVTLVDEVRPAGAYSVKWNGKDDLGTNLASGLYLYKLETREFVKVRKFLLVR